MATIQSALEGKTVVTVDTSSPSVNRLIMSDGTLLLFGGTCTVISLKGRSIPALERGNLYAEQDMVIKVKARPRPGKGKRS